MSDPSGQNLRIPLPAEISAGRPEKGSVPGGQLKPLAARAAAFLCGALVVAGFFQLAKSPAYLGGAGLFAALVTGIFAALLARADIPAPAVLRPLSLAAGGAAVTLICYVVAINAYSPGPLSALPYIQPVDRSNLGVKADGTVIFSVTVPSHYDQLTISFSATDDPNDACVNGSIEAVTPQYGASRGQVQDVATGAADIIQIPHGTSSFTLNVVFMAPDGFRQCHEEILVTAAQFSN